MRVPFYNALYSTLRMNLCVCMALGSLAGCATVDAPKEAHSVDKLSALLEPIKTERELRDLLGIPDQMMPLGDTQVHVYERQWSYSARDSRVGLVQVAPGQIRTVDNSQNVTHNEHCKVKVQLDMYEVLDFTVDGSFHGCNTYLQTKKSS